MAVQTLLTIEDDHGSRVLGVLPGDLSGERRGPSVVSCGQLSVRLKHSRGEAELVFVMNSATGINTSCVVS